MKLGIAIKKNNIYKQFLINSYMKKRVVLLSFFYYNIYFAVYNFTESNI